MPLLSSPLLLDRGFPHAFPTRDVTDDALVAGLGSRVTRIVKVRQVHGARVVEASASLAAPGDAAAQEADALVARGTLGPLAVGVRVADCVPVLVGDAATGDVAAIHAGWRGVVAGVVPAAIAALLSRGAGGGARGEDREQANDLSARPGALVAAIGPCIGACCFEVGRDVAARIGHVAREAGDKAYVDLRAAVRAQLEAAGVGSDRIDDVPGCTRHEPERFHSFRRDGADSGRMLAAIASIRME
jgi:copper oxidase (laccase) domain-containing protein